jgi:hypothetical protein
MVRILFFLQVLFLSTLSVSLQAQVVKIQKTIKWGNPQEIKISKYDKLKTLWFEGASYLEEPVHVPWLMESMPEEIANNFYLHSIGIPQELKTVLANLLQRVSEAVWLF